MRFLPVFFALFATYGSAAVIKRQATSASPTPDYYDTVSEGPYPGPTQTGQAPFLAEIDPVPGSGIPTGTRSFNPNVPLETSEPIPDNTDNINIFQYMGNLSPYFPNPTGFGVEEYSLPPTCNITQVHVLHRHGSRYPTTGANTFTFAQNIKSASGFNATGELSFLNTWTYQLGAEILVPIGRRELYDSGVYYYYNYGRLYNTSTKIVARTTSQDRMLNSGLQFLNGFFGLDWTQNATLEVIWEQNGFNNTLAGYYDCPNSNNNTLQPGYTAVSQWEAIYLANATARFKALVSGYNWTTTDTYAIQTLCPYETVAFGYSPFCALFTADEWKGFEYSIDLGFAGENAFGSPTGRAVGIGWVNELVARLTGVQPNSSLITNENSTLDDSARTFPLNQTLYFDFTHDTNIMGVLTALGLTQFAQYLPPTGIPENQQLIVSHMEPFGARMAIEKIQCSSPLDSERTGTIAGPPTTYIHMLLNQRTVPLGISYSACGDRVDGWCEYNAYLSSLAPLNAQANFTHACFGTYPPPTYGSITNGAPIA